MDRTDCFIGSRNMGDKFVFTALQEIKEDLNEHKKRIESLYTLYKNQEEQKKIEDEQI